MSCNDCQRLKVFRDENNKLNPSWFNNPVPSFGDINSQLLIVGLAPGLKGANRTGRPFTGDYAGDLLYPTLIKFGFAKGEYEASISDGLMLINCRITNAVRCVPPQNKPISEEINNCKPKLNNEISSMKHLKLILSLGGISHKSVISLFNLKQKDHPFYHEAIYQLNDNIKLISSYHCSRYNLNTNRLSADQFENVFKKISKLM